jgi:hypothetical protein
VSKCNFEGTKGKSRTCGLLAAEGSDLCPRHKYLAEVEAEQKRHKEKAKDAAVEYGVDKLPMTRNLLEKAGYKYQDQSPCPGCQRTISWWLNPTGVHRLPFDPMGSGVSIPSSHFFTCMAFDELRRSM